MFELLFVIGIMAWMFELLMEFLSELPVFPTLLTAIFAIPLLSYLDYNFSLDRQFLHRVGRDRGPIPPEVFRWSLVRPLWRRQINFSLALMPVGWLPIFWSPARWSWEFSSLLGWFCGLLAIGSTAIAISRLCLYFRVAQWFDAMTPRIAGWFWEWMYRISDNHEYLPEKKEPEKEKTLF